MVIDNDKLKQDTLVQAQEWLNEEMVALKSYPVHVKHAILQFSKALQVLEGVSEFGGSIAYKRKETEEKSKIKMSVSFTKPMEDASGSHKEQTIKQVLMDKELESVLAENYFDPLELKACKNEGELIV